MRWVSQLDYLDESIHKSMLYGIDYDETMTVVLHDHVFLFRLNLGVDPLSLFNWANLIGDGNNHTDWDAINLPKIDKRSFSFSSCPLL